jgi:hypothetical protein
MCQSLQAAAMVVKQAAATVRAREEAVRVPARVEALVVAPGQAEAARERGLAVVASQPAP